MQPNWCIYKFTTDSSHRFYLTLHSCLVHLPPPPPPPSPVTPQLSLSLSLSLDTRTLVTTSQTFGCHRRRILSLTLICLFFFTPLPTNSNRQGKKYRERTGESGRYGANHNNDPVLTQIEWISQSILSSNEIRNMGNDGVVPFVERLGGHFACHQSPRRGNGDFWW